MKQLSPTSITAPRLGLPSLCCVLPALLLGACSTDDGTNAGAGGSGQAGSAGIGGSAQGGSAQGGSAQGGSSQGGSGASEGGSAPGGSSNGANGGGGGSAGSGAETCDGAQLTQWEQKMLDDHNRWRGSVDPPAADMYRVHWDTAIAANAADWVRSCDPDWPHSPEATRSKVGGYDVLGENLSYCAGTGCNEDARVSDGSGLGDGDGWWEERYDYNWSDDSSAGVTSHYTQMVSSNVYAIGCATQKCAAPGPSGWSGEWWWTICQYGPRGQAYWVGNKPYDAGPGGLVEPPASVYDQHPGLCGN